MKEKKERLSLDALLQKEGKVNGTIMSQSNLRIKGLMKDKVREFHKKQQKSLEKASRIVLNA